MKKCVVCGMEKPINKYKYVGGSYGHNKTCKECLRIKRMRKKERENPTKKEPENVCIHCGGSGINITRSLGPGERCIMCEGTGLWE